MRLLRLLALALLLTPALGAQAFTTISATTIQDGFGSLLTSGVACFYPTASDGTFTVITPSGGSAVPGPFCTILTGGAFSLSTTPNLATAAPSGLLYTMVATKSNGVPVLTLNGLAAVGASYNLDALVVPTPPYPTQPSAFGLGIPYYPCLFGALYTRTDSSSPATSGWQCKVGGSGTFWLQTGQGVPPPLAPQYVTAPQVTQMIRSQGGGSFTPGGDLGGSSSSQVVVGLESIRFCSGFAPTNSQFIQLTTGGSPNPCWTSGTASGSGISAVSVATANGFQGSSSGGSTPILTLNVDGSHFLPGNTSGTACWWNGGGTCTAPSGAGIPTTPNNFLVKINGSNGAASSVSDNGTRVNSVEIGNFDNGTFSSNGLSVSFGGSTVLGYWAKDDPIGVTVAIEDPNAASGAGEYILLENQDISTGLEIGHRSAGGSGGGTGMNSPFANFIVGLLNSDIYIGPESSGGHTYIQGSKAGPILLAASQTGQTASGVDLPAMTTAGILAAIATTGEVGYATAAEVNTLIKTFTGCNTATFVLVPQSSTCVAPSAPMVYPGSGIAVSNGSAWVTSLTVPSGTILGTSDAQTVTNKRITKRVSALSANSATPAVNTDNFDVLHITAQTATITGFTVTGTPVDGDTLRISITGTASVPFTLGSSFEASTVPIPTTTSSTARLDMGFFWNTETSKWRIVAVQ